MPLTLVLGPANAAKAGEILGAYKLAADRGALLVVPTTVDAAHYDLELTEHGGMLGRALTFPRLLDEIATRAGFEEPRLTSLQKQRLLRSIIAELELPSIRESASSIGFSRAAGHLLSVIGRARASAPRFAAALSKWSAEHPERSQYARDLAAICLRYAETLERRGVLDSEAFSWGALDAIRAAPDRWASTPVYFYGFDDLTEIELDTITTLATVIGARTTVSLTFESDRPALAARAGVVETLRELATSVSRLPALDTYYSPGSRVALHHLERHLFEPAALALDPGDAVVLLEAGGERTEAEQVAEAVETAIASGVDPAEMVVVCRSLSRSAALYERALARRGIATSSSRRVPVVHTGLGRALRGLAVCAWRPESASAADLFSYLRAPGLAIDRAAIDAAAARARRAGITDLRGALALTELTAGTADAITELREAPDPRLALASAVRGLVTAPHVGHAPLLDAFEQLDARAAATVLDALQETATIDHGTAELIELLEEVEVTVAGQAGSEAVLIAEPLAIRARRFRWVAVTGLCEGEFPNAQSADGDPFLSEDDRRELAIASGLALPAEPDPLARERYLLYACVSRATDRVLISYRSSDEDGNLVMPSPFIDDLEQVLGGDWRERRRRRLLGDDGAPTLNGSQPVLARPPERQPVARVLGNAALAHVRHTQVLSGGALESYAACPVRWLIESQLKLRDLEPEAEPLAKGTFIHAMLEQVMASLGAPLTPERLPEAQATLTQRIAASNIDFAPGVGPEVKRALLRGIESDLRRYLEREAGAGNGWTPEHIELRFGFDPEQDEQTTPVLLLGAPGEAVSVRGVIDRVDVEPGGRRAVVRDYKSGRLAPDWAAQRWQTGHKLQVGLYMLAVRRLLELEPVAGFYQPLSGSDLRPRGAYLNGVEVGDGTFPNDGLSQAELDELLLAVESQAVELGHSLRRGELTPCPETCSGSGVGGCQHPGICWSVS